MAGIETLQVDMGNLATATQQANALLLSQGKSIENLTLIMAKHNLVRDQWTRQFSGTIAGTGEAFSATWKGDFTDKKGATQKGPGFTETSIVDTSAKTASDKLRIENKAQADIDLARSKSMLGEFENSYNRTLSIVQSQLIRLAFRAIVSAIQEGVQAAMEFELQISRLRTVSQDSSVTFNEWVTSVRGVSDAFGIPQIEVAKATYEALTSQVVKAGDSQTFMMKEAQFAQVTMSSLSDAVKLTTTVLNSYGMDVSHTEEVNAGLFKTMELGKVSISEIGNSFGRAAEMAHAIGVPIEELEASFVTLRTAGVKSTESMTLITSVMQSLLHPSKELQELMDSLGTHTAEAAIATYGWAGMLSKLETASKGSATELAHLFENIKSSKGIFALTEADTYAKSLNDIKNQSQQTYEVAKRITAENPARDLLIEFQKVKNYFIDDIGMPLVKFVDDFGKHFGGISELLLGLTKTLGVTAGGFAALKVSTFIFGDGLPNLIKVLGNTTTASNLMKDGFVVLNNATTAGATGWKMYGTALLGGIVGVAAMTAAIIALDIATAKTGADLGAMSENVKSMSETKLKDLNLTKYDSNKNELDAFKSANDVIFQAIEQTLAAGYLASSDKIKLLTQEAKMFGTEVAASFKIGMSELNTELEKFNRNISTAKEQIKSAQKYVEEAKASASKDIFGFKMDAASGNVQKQYALVTAEIQKTINAMNQEAKISQDTTKGVDKQAAAWATVLKYMSELEGLNKQRDKLADKSGKQQFALQPQDDISRGGAAQTGQVTAIAFTNQLLKIKVDLAEKYEASLARSITMNQKAADDEKKKIVEIEAAAKRYNEIAKEIEEGTTVKTKPEYQTAGKFDPEKVKQDLETQRQIVLNYAGPALSQAWLDWSKKTTELDFQLYKLSDERKTQQGIMGSQTRAANEHRELTKAYEAATTNLENKHKEVFDINTGSLTKATKDLKDLLDVFDSMVVKGDKLGAILNFITGEAGDTRKAMSGAMTPQAFNLDAIRQQATANIDAIKASILKIRQMPTDTPEGLKAATDEINKQLTQINLLEAQMKNYVAISKGIPTKDVDLSKIMPTAWKQPGTPDVSLKNMIDSLKQAIELSRTVGEAQDELNAQKDKVAGAQKSAVSGAPKEIQDALQKVLEQGGAVQVQLPNNMAAVDSAMKQTIAVVDELQRKLDILGKTNINIKTGVNGGAANAPQQNLPNGDNQFAGWATGGFVPRGTDRILAWLSEGEFVMNPQATKAFYSQLQAMNSAVRPGYYAKGGYVTTNVGDIKINYNSKGTTENDVRNLGNLLQRELRRGTITLNPNS